MLLAAFVFPALALAASLEEVATVGYATLNGGTTGGKGGKTVKVSNYQEFSAAAAGDSPAIIVVTGNIAQEGKIKVGSNKSIIGQGASLSGLGLDIRGVKNVIVRNLKISKVKADNGDAIGVQKSTNIWIDHVDVSSDQEHGKDYYDGLIDLTHAVDYATISNSLIHDHMKAVLIGHSDNNAAEDTGHLRVTLTGNVWKNINSRGPSLRFGTAHIFNNLYQDTSDGINVRKGASAVVENNVWTGKSQKPLYSVDGTGTATDKGNVFAGAKANIKPAVGAKATAPYEYSLLSTAEVASGAASKGATLTFDGSSSAPETPAEPATPATPEEPATGGDAGSTPAAPIIPKIGSGGTQISDVLKKLQDFFKGLSG